MGSLGGIILAGLVGLMIGVIAAGTVVSDTRNYAVARCINQKVTLEQCALINGWVK